jgi:glycosyltransferase involved in cell wall biosynthesis
MNDTLIISAFFSPNREVGAKRMSNLTDIWNRTGSNLTVLTINKNSIAAEDLSFIPDVDVIRTPVLYSPILDRSSFFKRLSTFIKERVFNIVDIYAGWIPFCVFYGLRIIRARNVKTIVVSGPPFSSFISAWILKKLTSVELVLDYRDPWTQYEWPKYHRFHNRKIWNLLERKIVKDANLVITCSNKMKKDFQLCDSHLITNGCEEPEPNVVYNSESFVTIAFAGQFYGERNLRVLLKPLTNLKQENQIDISKFKFVIYGSLSEEDKTFIRQYDLKSLIHIKDFVPRSQLLKELQKVDYLYLPSGKDVLYALPFKLFDYLSLQKPIICISPKNSAVFDFVVANKCGVAADPNDHNKIKTLFEMMIQKDIEISKDAYKDFLWSSLAKEYKEFIERSIK